MRLIAYLSIRLLQKFSIGWLYGHNYHPFSHMLGHNGYSHLYFFKAVITVTVRLLRLWLQSVKFNIEHFGRKKNSRSTTFNLISQSTIFSFCFLIFTLLSILFFLKIWELLRFGGCALNCYKFKSSSCNFFKFLGWAKK